MLKSFSLGSNLFSGLKHFVPMSLVTYHRAKCSFHKPHRRHCGLCAAVADIRQSTSPVLIFGRKRMRNNELHCRNNAALKEWSIKDPAGNAQIIINGITEWSSLDFSVITCQDLFRKAFSFLPLYWQDGAPGTAPHIQLIRTRDILLICNSTLPCRSMFPQVWHFCSVRFSSPSQSSVNYVQEWWHPELGCHLTYSNLTATEQNSWSCLLNLPSGK